MLRRGLVVGAVVTCSLLGVTILAEDGAAASASTEERSSSCGRCGISIDPLGLGEGPEGEGARFSAVIEPNG